MPKRPGVSAAIRLSQSKDVALWTSVASQDDKVVEYMSQAQTNGGKSKSSSQRKSSKTMKELHLALQNISQQWQTNKSSSLSKSDLLSTVIPWKFSVGKPRPALWKHLESNSDKVVKQASSKAIEMAQQLKARKGSSENIKSNIRECLQALTGPLQGVGPATASVILSSVRPDLFLYMYDEVIDTFLPQRTYTMNVYMECWSHCHQIALTLGGEWTPARVARTLWVAARVNVYFGTKEDLTLSSTTNKLYDSKAAKDSKESAEKSTPKLGKDKGTSLSSGGSPRKRSRSTSSALESNPTKSGAIRSTRRLRPRI